MIEDFMSVLENYPDVNLHSEAARRNIAEALVKHMCDHHIVTYTNLEEARKAGMDNDDQMDIPFERGL